MFEEFFQRPYHLARHRAGPYAEERQRYLSHLKEEGRASITLKHTAGLLLSIARHISANRDAVTPAQVECAAENWLHSQPRTYRSSKGRYKAKTTFMFHARSWLRFLRHLHEPPVQGPFDRSWMRSSSSKRVSEAWRRSPLHADSRRTA